MKNKLREIINTQTKRKLFDTLIAYLLMLGLGYLFVELAEFVIKKGTIPFEKNFLLWLQSISHPTLDRFMLLITELGGVYFIIAFTVFLLLYQWIKKSIKNTLFIGISVLGTVLLNTILKLFFQRPRPELWEQLINEKFYSFPSGHAMISMSLALVIIFVFWKSKYKKFIVLFSTIYVILVGLSRMYLGVHYPTDILGGWLMSSLWVILVHRIIYNEDNDLVDLFNDN